MAYDRDLADRIREAVGAEPNVTERQMFGGLAFLVNGNMAVAANSGGDLLVRAEPGDGDDLVESGDAELMVMRNRPMRGWLVVALGRVQSDEQLNRWIRIGIDYARSLPPK